MRKESVQYLANPDVSCREEGPGEGAILFNPDTDAILVINPTGLLLWRTLEQPRTQDQLATHLLDNCEGVPAGKVAGDVLVFLETLRPGGFIGEVVKDEAD